MKNKTNNIKILTPDGFVPFDGVRRLPEKQRLYKVVLENGDYLECSMEHEFVINGEQRPLKSIGVGCVLDTRNGEYAIKEIIDTKKDEYVYDLLEVKSKNHAYFTNNIISHNCDFLGASYTLIQTEVLAALESTEPTWHDEDWMVYEYPDPKYQYVLGVDVANGSGNDYSVIQVLKIIGEGRVEQVAIYRCNTISVFKFRHVILKTAKQYCNGHIIIENNTLGGVIAETLWWEDEYEHIFKEKKAKEFGVKATAKTKPLACALLKRYVEESFIKIYDKTTLTEFTYFVEVRPGVYGAMDKSGCHDDTVAALYWGVYLLHSDYWEDNKEDVLINAVPAHGNEAQASRTGGGLGDELGGAEYDDLPVPSSNGDEDYEIYNERYKGGIGF